MTRIQKVSLFLIIFMMLLPPFHVFAQNKILNIRHWAAPDHTRVVFDADSVIPFTIEKAERKLSIVFKNTDMPENLPAVITLNKRGVEKIILSSLPEKILRVELSIDANVETKVFAVKKIEDKPDRVVIDILFPDVVKQETKEREEVKVLQKNKIIVIDPGHGGEAPGAVGRKGTLEKKVVLEISRKLRDVLNKKDGYRAYLTRDGDYYVPFKKRMKITREYGADLFISIHADASKRRAARGSSVYCLSLGGASNEASRLLARNENLADIIGGSSNGENSDESDPIILNMFQTNTINSSKVFGSRVLRNLRRVNYVKYATVQEAPFIVLKLPEIPSILVETAFISNPREEKLLKSNRFQTDIAKAIAFAISDFLSVEPLKQPTPPRIILTKEIKPKSPDASDKSATSMVRSIVYRVEKGDTLEKIAIKFNTRISTLLKLNNMELDDPLYFGRSLKVPAQEKDVAEKKKIEEVKTSTAPSETPTAAPAPQIIAHKNKEKDDEDIESSPADTKSPLSKPITNVRVYKVKRGDSLDKIARRHNTTIGALLKLNKVKPKEPLYVGKNLKVPKQDKEKDDEDIESLPADTKPLPSKPITSVRVYKVKRGDSLDKIARRHNTTIGALLKLNKMKLKEPLYVGKNIKVPKQDKKIAKKKKDGAVKTSSDVAVSSASKPKPVVSMYTVKKGDTIEKIAGKHNTTITALLKLNNMKLKDPLYFGRKLKVPSTEKKKVEEKKTVSVKPKVHTYRVKKGDTLDKIAQKYKTSISELRELNKMKRTDILYVNQKLKLPSNSTL